MVINVFILSNICFSMFTQTRKDTDNKILRHTPMAIPVTYTQYI